jgi:endonuclease YncB( thermonuclease family)
VLEVADGDTITLGTADDRELEIRLAGIDAPEHGQAFGEASRQSLRALVLGKSVRVEFDKSDQYGRLVGKVWVQPQDCRGCGHTLDANLAQLTVGLAWWYRHYAEEQPEEDRARYEFAEREARAKRAGLWRDANPVPPWEWRHAGTQDRSTRGTTNASPACTIKGNISSNGNRIYHVPGQRFYAETRISTAKGERWFCSEAEARAAGWRRSGQ